MLSPNSCGGVMRYYSSGNSIAASETFTPSTQGLIPRAELFGNPEKWGASINSNGTRIGYLAPKNGLLNVFVIGINQIKNLKLASSVTSDTLRGIRGFGWTENPDVLYYYQDKGGDENWKAYSVNVVTGAEVCLTPSEQTTNQVVSPGCAKHPDHVLISSNKRDPSFHDLYLTNIHNGDKKMILENDMGLASITVDHEFSSGIAQRINPDSSVDLFLVPLDLEFTTNVPKASEVGNLVLQVPAGDAGFGDSAPLGFSSNLQSVYMTSYKEADTSAFIKFNLVTKSVEVFYGRDSRCDISGSLMNPVDHVPWAYQTNYDRKKYVAIDKADAALARDFEVLDNLAGDGGEWVVDSMSSDGNIWIASVTESDSVAKFHVYNRTTQTAEFLFSTNSVLDQYKFNKMKAVEITTRDGLKMLAYLTLPKMKNGSSGPVPLVVDVHGGPHYRDEFGFNYYHQFFSDRGYAVISPQFRGSTGFGKAFLQASIGEWGRKMHNDVIDACDWAVANGIAKKDKIAIHGGSYGGYAALVGLTFTPEYFSCAVDIVGVSNICTLLDSIPAYWGPIRGMFATRIGADTDTKEGREYLLSRSPISKVENIVRPLLIGQGANDPRVKQAESDQIFNAMVAKNIPVTYILYPDEGHGFARPPNSISFTAVTEAFLAKHLGGKCEPIGNAFEDSSLEFKGGWDQIELK
ncbi:aminopeptidase [Obelidium mucronatum]|nr:aminopeptidase [Obelidium mucronatum]